MIPVFGIAGNFARHLEQAGEAEDFVGVETESAEAPKGIFPAFLPGSDGFLGVYPLSSDTLRLPAGESVQMEPEVALRCRVRYEDGTVTDLQPEAFAAYNDATIRARKISEKKNWGRASKGVAGTWIVINRFEKGGVMDNYRIASFLLRGGRVHAYGVDSPLLGYSYFYERLKKWMIGRLNDQQETGPLENLSEELKAMGCPDRIIISIGATAYTEFGESTYLKAGDETMVVLYEADRFTPDQMAEAVLQKNNYGGMSLLRQQVVERSI